MVSITILPIALMAVYFIGMIIALIMGDRNQKVANYRRNILQQISNAGDFDIRDGYDWQWRYEVYETVSYEQMMRYFWRNLDSFYPDKSFLDGQVKRRADDNP